jgi:hypothetical protein
MNADDFNSLYPVGTLVFAYPGFRPEDASDARRLVTRTRTAAQVSASGDPVVWVEGEGSYICLTHVDPVSESVWLAAKEAEKAPAEPALSAPVGDQPQSLDDTRLAEIRSLDLLSMMSDRVAPVISGHLAALLAEVERLRAERHTTNEALDDAVQALREMRDRLAELERAVEQIRHLHKDSPMGPCPVCVDADAMARGEDYTVPYPCPTARLAGAKDCDPPSFRTTTPAEEA